MENVESRVKKIVAEQLGVNEADVKIDSRFVDDLGADSLDTVRVPVSNITKLAPGDRVDIFDLAGQPYGDSVLVLAIDSSSNSIIIEKPSSDIDGAGYTLKTNSQHRAKTFAAEDLAEMVASLAADKLVVVALA